MSLEPKKFGNESLTVPNERVAQNIYRDAVRTVAATHGIGSLAIDEAYMKARTELGLLLHNDKFRDSYEMLVDKSKQLLSRGKASVLEDPQKGGKSREQFEEFAGLHQELEAFSAEATLEVKVNENDVRVFIEVIEASTAIYRGRGYDPAQIVPENLYRLAQMVAGNFKAYEATLNQKD